MARSSRRRVSRLLWWLVSSSGHCPSVRHDVAAHPDSTNGAHMAAGASGLCHSSIPSERHARAALRSGLACTRPHVSSPSATRRTLADFDAALPGQVDLTKF